MNGVNISSASIPVTINDFFNKNMNQNLQYNLFNYNFVFPMFESKALLNFYLFNRASGDVVISKNKKYLFSNMSWVTEKIRVTKKKKK